MILYDRVLSLSQTEPPLAVHLQLQNIKLGTIKVFRSNKKQPLEVKHDPNTEVEKIAVPLGATRGVLQKGLHSHRFHI